MVKEMLQLADSWAKDASSSMTSSTGSVLTDSNSFDVDTLCGNYQTKDVVSSNIIKWEDAYRSNTSFRQFSVVRVIVITIIVYRNRRILRRRLKNIVCTVGFR